MDFIFQPTQPTLKDNLFQVSSINCFPDTLNDQEKSIVECRAKIEELEDEMMRLREENQSLRRELTGSDESKDMTIIISNYEKVMEKLMQDHENVKKERTIAKNHLGNLEKAFYDLVEKYERAKVIIQGFEKNECSYQHHLAQYEETIHTLEKKYNDFKEYAMEKLNEANNQLEINNKEHSQEVAVLKAKLIQTQLKASELERQKSRSNLKEGIQKHKNSIFEPLTSNIT